MTDGGRPRKGLEHLAVTVPRFILGALAFLGIGINFANVVGRYVFSSPIIWAEEILVYFLIWCVFVGAILVTWEGRHIKMDLLAVHLPSPWRQIVNGLMSLVFVLVCVLVVSQSWNLTWLLYRLSQLSMVARIPMALVQGAILVGFAVMLIAVIVRLRSYLSGEFGSDAEATAQQLREMYGDFEENGRREPR